MKEKFCVASRKTNCYNSPVENVAAPDTYVDTCFLVKKAGRDFLLDQQTKVIVIQSVDAEINKLEADHEDAREARNFIKEHPELFALVPRLPEERDIQKSLPPEKTVQADTVFRRIAIRCVEGGKAVRFLTADLALAAALSAYEGVQVSFLPREGAVAAWSSVREAYIPKAVDSLREKLLFSDVVLSSSGLLSPYIMQFLRNVAAASVPGECLPIVHKLSKEAAGDRGHLTRELLVMLGNADVVRSFGSEAKYATERALLDALYFARTSGRPVSVVVADWSVADWYNPLTRAAEMMPDAVNFYVLNAWGELCPLLRDWRLLRAVEGKSEPPPATVESVVAASEPVPKKEKSLPAQEVHAGAEAQKNKEAKNEPQDNKSVLSMEAFDELAKKYNQKVGVRVRLDSLDTLAEELRQLNPEEPEAMIVLGILSARRQNKPEMAKKLIEKVKALHPYCLQTWFRQGKGAHSPKVETILKNDAFFKLTKSIISKSRNLKPCIGLVARLNSLRPKAPERVDYLLEQVQKRGAQK